MRKERRGILRPLRHHNRLCTCRGFNFYLEQQGASASRPISARVCRSAPPMDTTTSWKAHRAQRVGAENSPCLQEGTTRPAWTVCILWFQASLAQKILASKSVLSLAPSFLPKARAAGNLISLCLLCLSPRAAVCSSLLFFPNHKATLLSGAETLKLPNILPKSQGKWQKRRVSESNHRRRRHVLQQVVTALKAISLQIYSQGSQGAIQRIRSLSSSAARPPSKQHKIGLDVPEDLIRPHFFSCDDPAEDRLASSREGRRGLWRVEWCLLCFSVTGVGSSDKRWIRPMRPS